MFIYKNELSRMTEKEVAESLNSGHFFELFEHFLEEDYLRNYSSTNIDLGLTLSWSKSIIDALIWENRDKQKKIAVDDVLMISLERMMGFMFHGELSQRKSLTSLMTTLNGFTEEDALMGDLSQKPFESFAMYLNPLRGILLYIKAKHG